MKRLGIRGRVILLALVPSLVIALSLTGIYTRLRLVDLERGLEEQGLALATYLAPASEYGVFSGNLRVLETLSNAAIGDNQVRSVSIEGLRGKVLVHQGSTPRAHRDFENSASLAVQQLDSDDGESLFVRAPVQVSELDIEDFSPDPDVAETPKRYTIGWVTVELTRATMRKHKRQLIGYSIAITLLAAGFIMALALRWSSGIIRPVHHITQAVGQLENGQLDTRLSLEGEGELQSLQRGINAMARSLQTAQQDLQQKVDAATRHLRETLRTAESQNIELEAAKEHALAASQEKSAFLTHMSHELRTPLNGVLGYCELLGASELNSEQRSYTEIISNSSEHLLGQINELLDLSRIEAGEINLESSEFHLGECIEDVLDLLAPGAHAKGLELVYFMASDIPPGCQGDPLRIRQVVLNLVANGIKFTPAGSVIVTVTRADENSESLGVEITVSDTGVGIPADQQQQIFQPYQQADPEHKANGTGLGLAISTKLAVSMGGGITVESEAGQGSTFTFTLHCCQSPLPAYEPSGLEGIRVSLYAPHPFTRMSVREQMRNWGIRVRDIRALTTPTGRQSPGQNRRAHPDCAILDLSREDDKQGAIARMALSCPLLILDHRDPELLAPGNRPCTFLRKPVRNAELRRQLQRLTGIPEEPDTTDLAGEKTCELMGPDAHILLVEDNAVNQKLITTLLGEFGIQVSQAVTGQQALEAFFRYRFDLILMDLHLPDRDGLWLSERLHLLESGTRRTPIIALSADATPASHRLALAAGMAAFLTKPLDRATLRQTLERWLPNWASAPIPEGAPPPEPKEKPSLEAELGALLREDLRSRPETITRAFEAKDWRALSEEAHTIAGGAACCGATELKSAARALEQAIIDTEYSSIATRVEQLRREIEAQLQT